MKIFNLEAIDMGNNQNEIAKRIMEIIGDSDFKCQDEFFALEDQLVTQACRDLNWTSVPQNGGLIVNWDSKDGEFINEC